MAYMCADSGNLMAIAQQVIQQKQQQQQNQLQIQSNNTPTTSQSHPFSHPPPSWPHHFPDPTSFILPDVDDLSPLHASVPFGLSSAFESDDWMEALIGDSPTASNDYATDTWHPPEPPLFDHSDLDRVFDLTAASEFRDPVTAAFNDLDGEASIWPPILKSLVDVASLVDSDPDLAAKSLTRIRDLASDLGDPTERVAFYFSEALVHRLKFKGVKIKEKIGSCSSSSFDFSTEDFTLCFKSLNDACPYFKFAHFTANQAVLEATEHSDRIHIIDFGIVQGVQWAALLQALATRSTKKPSKIRISGVPSPDLGEYPANSLAATGIRLKSFANLLDLDFEFDPILTPVHELTRSTFRIESDESVAVNFMLQLNNYLDETPLSVERILRVVKYLHPNVLTLGEYDVNLSRVSFSDRFTNALNYFSAIFESIEPGFDRESTDRVRVERFLFGHRILNAVGPDKGKRERMEERENWAALMESCGFESVPLSNYAVSQATILLRDHDYSKKYKLLDSVTGFLSLAWEERPLLTVSSWRNGS